jgi:hypothetical protein
MKLSLIITAVVSWISWIGGMLLLYPTLHWKGIIGILLLVLAYKLDIKNE